MNLTRRRFLTTAAAALGASAAQPIFPSSQNRNRYSEAVSTDPSLLAYWRMEGNLDDLRENAPGAAQGGQPRFVDRSGEQAVSLDQGVFLAMGPTPHLDGPISTIELFFQLTSSPLGPHNPCFIAKRSSREDCRFSVHVHRDLSHFVLWNGGYSVDVPPLDGPLEIGRWYHLVITHLRYRVQAYNELYLDGVPCEKSAVSALNLTKLELPLQIGASTPQGDEQCSVAVDEVAFYKRYLSAEDIALHIELAGRTERRDQLLAITEARAQRRQETHQKRVTQLLADPALKKRGTPQVYKGEYLEAVSMPIGGIATGAIQISGQASLHRWHIFNNHTQAKLPHSFFAIRAQASSEQPVVRALQTETVGPFAPCSEVEFRGEYPLGRFTFRDPALPVGLEMEVFSPHIPLETERSSIPCAVFDFSVNNPTRKPVEVAFLGSLQNAVGFNGQGEITGRGYTDYGGNLNRILDLPGMKLVHMSSNLDRNLLAQGDMALGVFDEQATGDTSWTSLENLLQDFAADGRLDGATQSGPSPAGETYDAALASTTFLLQPGESRSVRFLITWHFPNAEHGLGEWKFRGNRYAARFDDALHIARHLAENLDELSRLTRLYHDTFYRSNLPYWLLDRISSQSAILASPTVFWSLDGYFGGFEGCRIDTGCCAGNCSHVWHYAQSHARLFPEVGRQMREASYQHQTSDGNIPFRHHLPTAVAFDGQCGEILGSYREHLCSPDNRWLSSYWPKIKRAMDLIISKWDSNEDGVPTGQQHNTLDAELGGSSSWLGTLYLAALKAAAQMAEIESDKTAAERYQRIAELGAKTQDGTLFNGEYYIQRYDGQEGENYLRGCHIDQLLGQWWASQLDLGWLYPLEHVRSALKAIFKYNFRTSFQGIDTGPQTVPRRFVLEGDFGTLITTWPSGGRPEPPGALRFANEVWTGFEYSTAAAMIQTGLVEEALLMVRAAAQRYDGRLRSGLTDRAWGYSGNPFSDDECGKFYARALSVWSIFLACQGFLYDGPVGKIGFKPKWQANDHASFFSGSEGWGLFSQEQFPKSQRETLELVSGKLRLKQLVFELPTDAAQLDCEVSHEGQPILVRYSLNEAELRVELSTPVEMVAPAKLEVQVRWS